MPPEPRDSQSLPAAVTTFWRVVRASRRNRDGVVVVVELAGRGLAEFWAALLSTLRPWRRRVWVTVHDSPEVCGGAFFFRLLDRRGGRRVADFLSRRVGRRAEGALLRRAERVHGLSRVGCDELVKRYSLTRPVIRIGHVAQVSQTATANRRAVFLPGYLGGVHNVVPVLRALREAPSDWTIELGACDRTTTDQVDVLAHELGVNARLRRLGFCSEAELVAAFERAAIVVRWRHSGWARAGEPQHGATSGPLIQAMAHGCAIVTNDGRGIAECLPAAQALCVADADEGASEVEAALSRLIRDDAERAQRSAAGREHVAKEHSVTAVASRLACA